MATQTLMENPRATASAGRLLGGQDTAASQDDTRKAIKLRVDLLLATDPDCRLRLLESSEWKFNEEHLRQVNTAVETLIDAPARRQLKEMANRCLDRGDNHFTIVHEWLTGEKCETLEQLVSQTNVPDRLMTFCYAWLEVYEAAMAVYCLEENRRLPDPGFGNLAQTAEDLEGDRRFAGLA